MVGLSAISVTVAVLTQTDKVILSRLLTLEAFGYYALAWAVANALTMLIAPVFSAFFPSLARAVAIGDGEALSNLYHRGSQLMAALLIPTGVMLFFFSREALELWTRSASLANNTHFILSILVVGTTVNGLMNIPYGLLLAHGWTSLPFYANLVAIAVLVPLVFAFANFYGAIGAAYAWLILNVGHMLVTQQILHRRLLPKEKVRWYLDDTLKPLLAGVAIAGIGRLLLGEMTTFQFLAAGSAVFVATAVGCAISLRYMRSEYLSLARRLFA
jgi:O-antigen/teichoic acid export membrane protein